MKSLSFGIILPVVLPFVCARVIPEQQAISSWSIEKDQPAPGIGVHFTTSYANAAISYDNGTVQDIVRVRADADYIELMGRLANPSNHMKACSGLARRLLRQGRKLFGLPPTGDVAVLSSFVRKVKYSIEEELGSTASQIMPAFPVLIGLEEEDFHDVMRLAGLTWFQASETDAQPYFHETTAAYAGLGYGLCESWKSPSDCSLEEQKMSYEHILFLNFDNSSFSASVQYMQSARSSWVYSNAVDPHLGWWDLPVYEVPRARFWSRIHEVVLDIAGALQHAPNKIILLGEHSADEEFLDVVKTALWEVLEYDATMLLEAEWEDVGLLGARGAAELARRAQFWIEAPQEDGIEL